MSVHLTASVWMWPLLLIVAAGAVLWTHRTYSQTHPAARPPKMRLLFLLRSSALLALVLAIAGPVLSVVQTTREPAEILVLIEDSASMAITDAGPQQASRWNHALDFTRTVQNALSQKDFPATLRLMRGNGLIPSEEFRLEDAVIPVPDAHGTNLGRFVSQQTKAGMQASAATILLSDGQETVLASGLGNSLHNSLIPDGALFIAGVGDSKGAADRLITDLRYPDTVFAGDNVVVQLAVSHRFTDGTFMQEMVVRLSDATGVLVQQIVVPQASIQSLELEFVPSEPGMHSYELEVSPLDNERFQANNKVSLGIDVQKSKARILLLSEFPGWDVRFLAQAALKEPRVELHVVYAAAGGLVFADSLKAWQNPPGSVGWLEWDAVILTSWSGKLAGLDWVGLAEAVDQGLGLLVLPGGGLQVPKVRPLQGMPEALKNMVPLEGSSWYWKTGSFFLSSGAGLQGHPVLLGVVGNHSENGKKLLLENLPPLPGVIPMVPKEGALVLLSGVSRNTSTASSRVPVLVVGHQGVGPVAWLAGRRIWETAFWNQGGLDFENDSFGGHPVGRLLRNLLVWISSGVQDNGLAFTGHRAIFQAGERIPLTAQWRNLRGEPLFDCSMYLLLDQENGELGDEAKSFSFGAMDPQTGVAGVELPALRPGRYSVQLLGAGDPAVVGPKADLTVLDHSVEETQVRLDKRNLVQLAGRLGGTYHELVDEEAVAHFVADIMAVPFNETETVQRQRYDFWLRWPFLILVASLLGYEWFLRRRQGML